jgi:hypothetical protein
MRLLERQSDGGFRLTENLHDKDITRYPYTILSHTWLQDNNEELTYEDISQGSGCGKVGYEKLIFCAEQTTSDGFQYFWVDSCCIKKSSDAELSESINSMYRWYQRAVKCYVYLSDVSFAGISTGRRKREDYNSHHPWEAEFRKSRWFTRGWTLQELLAPDSVEFFSREGTRLGDKRSLKILISDITGISVQALEGSPLQKLPVAERMRWASGRDTTKSEDLAYCLVGIFGVSMAARYGEGKENALQRLENKINKAHTTAPKNQQPLIHWLSSPDPAVNYENALKQRQQGIGQWLLRHKRYAEWKSSKSQFLWLHGIPGCGKSILSSTVLEDLLELDNHPTEKTVVYFYFDFNDPQKRRSDLMVRSILTQLLQQIPGSLPIIATLFSSCDSGRRQPTLSACINTL